jgi:hypothetical protein
LRGGFVLLFQKENSLLEPTAPHHKSKILEGKVNIAITIYKLARVLDYITLVPYLDVLHP